MAADAPNQVAAERVGAGSRENPEVTVVANPSNDSLSSRLESNMKLELALPGNSRRELKEASRMPPPLLAALLCILSALEGADVQLLPCAFFALGKDLGLTATNLATLNAVQAFSGVISAPLWAFFADQRIISRRRILILGSICQGLITVTLGLVTWWVPMIILRGLNGVMLASLRPVCMGIVADTTSEENRGKVYGFIQLAMQLGMFVSTMTTTPLSTHTILGFYGWRVAFVIVGLLGVLVGTLAVLAADVPETPHSASEKKGGWKVLAELRHVLSFFRSPTFNVLIIQGLFGCMAMSAGSFGTMYFQMVGISDVQAGLITSFGQVACAIGILFGGFVGDWAARLWRNHGRVLVAEVSLAVGVPLVFFKFWGVPAIVGSFGWYAALTILHGLLAVWVTAGAKLPLLSEIVPADRRSAVMAWDSTLEGALSALFGGPMVAFIAQTLYGFTSEDLTRGRHNTNAMALGRASAVMSCIPALLSLACWPLMHLTYPRDLKRKAVEEGVPSKSDDDSEGSAAVV